MTKATLHKDHIAEIISALIREPHMAAPMEGEPVMTDAQMDDYMDTMASVAAAFADEIAKRDPFFKRASFMIDCGLANYSRVLINLRTQETKQII